MRPDDLPAPLRELLGALRELHLRAGRPSVREIAHSTDKTSHPISRDTVHRVLKRNDLPRWDNLQATVVALSGDVETFQKLWISARRAMDGPERGSD
jgi:hypothetical protein